MKKIQLFYSVLASIFTASTFAATQPNCPTLQDIQNNALLFDSVYHAKNTLPKTLEGIAKESDVFSSKPLEASSKKWYLLTPQLSKEMDDNQNIQQAQMNAREVIYQTGIIYNVVPGKYEFKACMYRANDIDATAIYTKGKLPVRMNELLTRVQHSALV